MVSQKFNIGTDPLGEENITVSRGLMHRYENRVLLALTSKCATECPFCYRRWQRANNCEFAMMSNKDIDEALIYIKQHKKVNEVVLSGGDPLMNVKALEYALKLFDKEPQIKVIRIHTRMPIVKPKMVTMKILTLFKRVKNSVLYISLHINSSNELSKETIKLIGKIRKTGAILFSQSVFLRGINDSVEALTDLFTKLLQLGVRPYNIYHCSTVNEAEHFIVPVEEEAKIMTEVKKRVSGLAFPTLIMDTPGTAGKIPVPLNFWKSDLSCFWDYEGNKFNAS